ncbi:GerAB/ArcD/ProY family transporter [Metabacillus sp. KIGAM252]|uniref:GerAB/ArcD/ProY family transporter n=1 Tax=Metabacillus flavus TaxID=2823519 RepID=A0ABS5LCW8_9BACI|nr:GerAB/ArcD/ProY family transporter [Metabacillus flavus]MBS2968590.1 GerAB/ArcD/ProY family transporter [Metabacillus flavus]
MTKIAEKYQVSHFLVFYLVHGLQFGVGVLGFQRIIAKDAGQDAWIPVIVSGVFSHLMVWMIYKILKGAEGNIHDIHHRIFGKWLGKGVNLLISLYFTLLAIEVLRTFVEIIQVWMFPDMNVLIFSTLFLALVYYIVTGGFRVVTGICFFGVVLPGYLILTFFFPLEFAEWKNLMPMFDHSFGELLSGTKSMSLTVLGFEALLVYYPFIKNAEKSQKWAHGAILFTTSVYLLIMVVTLVFFSTEQLQKNIWATLTIWKIVEIPFVERFEYIGIANWNLVILPNICLTLWCASRGIKQTLNIAQKKSLLIVLGITLIAVNLFETREQIDQFNGIMGDIGLGFYVYIPIILFLQFFMKKVKKQGRSG